MYSTAQSVDEHCACIAFLKTRDTNTHNEEFLSLQRLLPTMAHHTAVCSFRCATFSTASISRQFSTNRPANSCPISRPQKYGTSDTPKGTKMHKIGTDIQPVAKTTHSLSSALQLPICMDLCHMVTYMQHVNVPSLASMHGQLKRDLPTIPPCAGCCI
jgi:hypothetical protein